MQILQKQLKATREETEHVKRIINILRDASEWEATSIPTRLRLGEDINDLYSDVGSPSEFTLEVCKPELLVG